MNICGNYHIKALVQSCGISIANALEIQQSCTDPSRLHHSENTRVSRCLVSPTPTCLLKELTTIEHQTPHCWHFVGENYWWPLDYSHTLSVMEKACACRDVGHDLLLISPCCRVMNYTSQPTLMAKDSWWCKIMDLNSPNNAAFNLFDLPSAPLLVEGPGTSIFFIAR